MKLHYQIVLAIILGVLLGIFSPEVSLFIAPLGDIFVSLLKLAVIPLILASMVMGCVNIGELSNVGRLGFRTVLYFLFSTVAAIVIGMITFFIIKPEAPRHILGSNLNDSFMVHAPKNISDVVLSIFPSNIFEALAQGNILAIIFFSILLGCLLVAVGQRAEPLIEIFDSLEDVVMKMTSWIIRLTPIGVASLTANAIARSGLEMLLTLGYFSATVVTALLIHAVILLPLLLIVLARISPLSFIKDMFPALITGFSTSSSAASMPVAMDSLVRKAKLSESVSGFVLPIGTTMNMNGTACFQAISVLFLANLYGIQCGISEILVIVVTTTLAAVGSAGIPSAGLVTMAIILGALGVPVEAIGIIILVDRFLDMLRTSVNIWGNSVGVAILSRVESQSNIAETPMT